MLSLCKEIVTFLILAKILESFQSGNKYGKFIKLIISFIVVLKIITPVFSFFGSEFDFEDAIWQIEQRLVMEENTEVSENIRQIEPVEIEETKVEVEEIWWKE